ncbi:M3 family metallopeptidase [Mycoplasmopsis gallopavonis]|uniref:Oligoendopeptidase F, plasmid n=1 Tax=Mycoplasmopsis gallopavonis TaxID=76629 RepID=A0A449AYL1_9BACT|nr:M3 family metallopeptidase [Mycoplasmopsis gallopavonis]RIV16515.1 hypothetical protein D1113_02045 [Mycoplasmopsis gallopavonis]VEU72590.1 Oligoendopeptidase F, plasmid [Mycoplasmopsis gallopavonis]
MYKKISLKNKLNLETQDLIAAIYVPHFYYSFYVYKYAIGHLAASFFFSKYKKEGTKALEFYIENFLSAGSSDWPLNILKNAGIDFSFDQVYEDSFNYVETLIEEWVKLGEELFN